MGQFSISMIGNLAYINVVGNYFMKNKKFKITLTVVVVLIALSFASKKYREYDLIKHSTYGPNWNSERKKRKMPLIEEDMRPGRDFTELTNRWWTESYPTEDKKLVHTWKKVLVSDGRSFREIDAFRYHINDTIYRQLNLTSEIEKDSTLISGQLGWIYTRPDALDRPPWQQLTQLQIDSVKRLWGIK